MEAVRGGLVVVGFGLVAVAYVLSYRLAGWAGVGTTGLGMIGASIANGGPW